MSQNIELYEKISAEILSGAVKPADALQEITDHYQLQLEPKTRRVLNMILDETLKVGRFTGHGNLTEKTRGNTALHTLQVMMVVAETVMRAFPEVYPEHENDGVTRVPLDSPLNTDKEQLKKQADNAISTMLTQTLMHDFGEIFVELSSLSQRMKTGKKEENPKAERHIAEFALRLGFYAVENEEVLKAQGYKAAEDFFSQKIEEVRKELNDITPQKNEAIVGQSLAAAVEKATNLLKNTYGLDVSLSPEDSFKIGSLMHAYDEPEGHSTFAAFYGRVVKNAQNTQTVIHMVEKVGEDGAPAYEQAPSPDVVQSLWYTERGLPNIYQAVENTPFKQRIAQQAAIMSFETNLGLVEHASIPKVVDRAATYHHLATSSEKIRSESRAVKFC